MIKGQKSLAVAAILLGVGSGLWAVDPPGSARAFGAGNDAWSRGDYPAALAEYLRVLNSADAAEYHDRIALKTGELFQSVELTADGRSPRFSADGRLIAYETGLETSRRTRIVRNDGSLALVADLPGISPTFSPTGASVAYLKVTDTPELLAAAKALDGAALTAGNRGMLVQMLAWHVLSNTTLTVLDLATLAERAVPTPGLMKTGLVWPLGANLYFVGTAEEQALGNDIYAVEVASGRVQVISNLVGFKTTPFIDPSGRYILFNYSQQDVLFRRPASVLPPTASRNPGARGSGVPQNGSPSAPSTVTVPSQPPIAPPPQQPLPSFVVFEVATGRHVVRSGSAPSVSADGSTVVFVDRDSTGSRLLAAPLMGGASTEVKSTNATGRIDAPAISGDGSRVSYQSMNRDDWELFVSDRDGKNETRLTRDPQHDLLPQFVAGDRVLQVIGEPRHRRSFLLDLKTGAQTRLFHNNTIRTIAPEYQWIVSKDGTQLLIGAERDGNTVSPERGVYLLDLNRKVTKADLVRRLETQLAGERALRDSQTKAFAPIAKDVRAAVDDVSVDRVFGYEKALFEFDSKHISRPGNKLAVDYLFETYKSFGYVPELQTFSPQGALGGQTSNVIARLAGAVNPELVYVISSHFDSVANGPGADDDSSGTAALLEAARVLAGRPQPATIIFASFTGEEAGLLGSREFVRRAVAGKMNIVGALNNDMIGWSNDSHIDNTIRYSNPGIRDIQHGAAILFSRLITYDALYFKGTDAASYYDAYGDIVGGIGSHPVLSSPHYHQPHDLLEFQNHVQIAETSKTTVATIMRLASSPSRLKNLKVESVSGGTATVSWDPSPEKGVTSYVVTASPPAGATGTVRPVTVNAPRATVRNVAPGSLLSVKAVNSKGLESWDAVHVKVP